VLVVKTPKGAALSESMLSMMLRVSCFAQVADFTFR
jgi:hypothetical protein